MILIYLVIMIIIIRTGNINSISGSFSQVGIVRASGATLRKPELCRLFIVFPGLTKFMSEP